MAEHSSTGGRGRGRRHFLSSWRVSILTLLLNVENWIIAADCYNIWSCAAKLVASTVTNLF